MSLFTGVSLLFNLFGGNGTGVVPSTNSNIFGNNFGLNNINNNNNASGNLIASVLPTRPVNLQLQENPFRHSRILDPRGRYRLAWEIDWKDERIYFNVSAETRGYVGFGLSKKGKMSGADIVIGGVDSHGKPYFWDMHAVSNQIPVLDKIQSYILHDAYEQGTVTFLSFSRAFDTCDKDGDLEINENDLLSVMWAFGERDDEVRYHYEARGSYDLYLMDPDFAPQSLIDTFPPTGALTTNVFRPSFSPSLAANVFTIREQRMVPQQDSFYFCTFHRAPTFTKHHIIGFDVNFPTELDRRSVHHFLLHRCEAPQNSPALPALQQASLNGGGECYLGSGEGPNGFLNCREIIYGWAVGNRAHFFPDHVGIPMSESGTEYFMFQVHYDNPNLLSNLTVTASLDIYYSSTLRPNDAAMLMIGSTIPGATNLIIPPNSIDHNILGFCAEGCTQRMFPREGVTVFSAVLHTHLTGRAGRLRHFRGKKELPWIIKDDNYNFNYQQSRLLPEERRVLPGDQLVQSCVYDSTMRNGTVVTGGYSTREEMCVTFLYYYNRVPGLINCVSEIREASYRNLLGIQNTTFDVPRRETVITNPLQFAGLSVSNYLTNNIEEWNLPLREELQRQHRFQPQISFCPTLSSAAGSTPAPPTIGNVRNQFIQQQGRIPGYSGDISQNPGPPYNFIGTRPGGGSTKPNYNYNIGTGVNPNGFNFGRFGISATTPIPIVTTPAQTIVVNQEQTRLRRRIKEYQPISQCGNGWGKKMPEEFKGKRPHDDDLRTYPRPDYEEGKNFESNKINYDDDNNDDDSLL